MSHESNFAHVFERLSGVRPAGVGAWKAFCPTHEDRKPSLSLRIGDNGAMLVHCFGGCDKGRILGALGLEMADLYDEPNRHRALKKEPTICAVYPYSDENGLLLYQKVRYDPKDFRVRRPNPEFNPDSESSEQWIYNLKGVRLVIYDLPHLRFELSKSPERRVLLLDGEKDVETAKALGFLATCPPQGGESWTEEMADQLGAIGANVIIVPDEDLRNKKTGVIVGHSHARRQRDSLLGKVPSVAIARIPPIVGDKRDLTDMVLEWPEAERKDRFRAWLQQAVVRKSAADEVRWRLNGGWMRVEEAYFYAARAFAKITAADEIDREDALDAAAALLQLADAL